MNDKSMLTVLGLVTLPAFFLVPLIGYIGFDMSQYQQPLSVNISAELASLQNNNDWQSRLSQYEKTQTQLDILLAEHEPVGIKTAYLNLAMNLHTKNQFSLK